MTAADPEGRVRHLLDVMHKTYDDAGDPIAAGMVPVADGLGQVDYIDSSTFGGGMDWFNVEDYGAVHDGSTDDTPSIQDAIDACIAAGGGTVYFPSGIYQISGALQDTSTYNSQLEITPGTYPMSIRLLGHAPMVPTSGGNAPSGGSILRSDWNGTISGHPAVFSCGTWGTVSTSVGPQVRFEDIGIQVHNNPKLSGIQANVASSLSLFNVLLQPSVSAGSVSVPTNTNAVGVEMPNGYTSQFPDYLESVAIEGFYTGLRPSEQANGTNLGFAWCAQAIEFVGNAGSPAFTFHANTFTKVLASLCPRVLVFTGDERWVFINLLNVEHDTAPWAVVYDIDDASNFARGFIGIHTIVTGGSFVSPLINGGTKLSWYQAHDQRWRLATMVDIPTGTNPSTNPATGRTVYTDSSTGHLSVRTTSGSVVDLETGSPSFATPSIALSSTAAAGAASTVIRSDSTIAAFDATVPTTIAYADAAATGSAAFAARRDHRHGAPAAPTGIGPILISDTPSTPLIFGDLIQNEAQTDLVYADP